jgi:hypothetical protein
MQSDDASCSSDSEDSTASSQRPLTRDAVPFQQPHRHTGRPPPPEWGTQVPPRDPDPSGEGDAAHNSNRVDTVNGEQVGVPTNKSRDGGDSESDSESESESDSESDRESDSESDSNSDSESDSNSEGGEKSDGDSNPSGDARDVSEDRDKQATPVDEEVPPRKGGVSSSLAKPRKKYLGRTLIPKFQRLLEKRGVTKRGIGNCIADHLQTRGGEGSGTMSVTDDEVREWYEMTDADFVELELPPLPAGFYSYKCSYNAILRNTIREVRKYMNKCRTKGHPCRDYHAPDGRFFKDADS